MELFVFSEDDQIMASFYSDIVSSVVFRNPQSFISKYPEDMLTNYSSVVYLQMIIKQMIKESFIQNCEKLGQIKQLVNSRLEKISQQRKDSQSMSQQKMLKLVNCISLSIFNRLEQIKSTYLLESISLGSSYLKDVNWKITKTISSNSKSFSGQKYPYSFNLTLILRKSSQNQSNEQGFYQISLQMNKIQLKKFLNQLKLIKTQMNSINNAKQQL